MFDAFIFLLTLRRALRMRMKCNRSISSILLRDGVSVELPYFLHLH